MNLFELAAKLTLDSSEYESGLSSAVSIAGKVANKIGSAIGTGIKIGTAAIGAAATGIASFAKSSVEAASTFETSFAQLNTIMDATAVSVDDMQTGLIQMSSQLGVSASELAETTYNAISATGDTAGALSIVENATKLATAGFTDTSSALSVLTTTMNSYKMSSEDLADVSDSLIAVQNTGVLTVSDLSSSMGKAIATASAYGVDLYNLESAYISLTKNGIDTAEGTTYLRSMLKELGSESSTVSKTIQTKTGKSFSQLTKEGKSLGDVLGVLYNAVDGDTNALMNLWSSTEAGTAASAIVSQGLETFNDNLVMLQESAGATQNAYDIMTDTLSHKTEVLKTNFENLKIAFGNGLIPGVGDFVDLLSTGIGNITAAVQEGDWDTAFSALGDMIGEGLSKAIEESPKLITGAINILSALGTSLAENADAIIDGGFSLLDVLFGSMNTENGYAIGTKVGEFVGKIAGKLGENLKEYITAATNFITGLATGLLSDENITAYSTAIGAIITGLVTAIPQVTADFIVLADAIIGGLETGIKHASAEAITGVLLALSETLSDAATGDTEGVFSGLIDKLFGEEQTEKVQKRNAETFADTLLFFAGLQQFVESLGEWSISVSESIAQTAIGIFDSIKERAQHIWEEIKTTLSGTWENIKTAASEAWEGIKTGASAAWEAIKTTVTIAVGTIQKKIEEFKAKIEEIKTKFEELKEKVTNVFETIKTTISEKIQEAWQWGYDLVKNIAKGIGDAISLVTTAVSNVATTIWSHLHETTAEVGPLKDSDKWGGDLMDNIINGIENRRNDLERTISDVAESMDFSEAMTGSVSLDESSNGWSGNSEIGAKLDAVAAKIDALTDAILNQTWELDGEVVASNVDRRLGETANMKART